MISTKKIPPGQIKAPVGGKKTQIIQFVWTGTNYGANANWWRFNRTASNNLYTAGFSQSPSVDPSNAFSDDQTAPGFEQLMFDGIVKEVFVTGFNNGVSWNCDLAIRSFEVDNIYNVISGLGFSNSQIIARETIVRDGGSFLSNNQFLASSISSDVLPKGTCLRPYFKSEGVANSNWQNALIQILIEEA